jgi:hypothetical protein
MPTWFVLKCRRMGLGAEIGADPFWTSSCVTPVDIVGDRAEPAARRVTPAALAQMAERRTRNA